MVAFVFSIAHTLDTATRKFTQESIPLARIGYQDDQYFKTKVKDIPRVAQVITQALVQAGHKLNEAKCGVWILALDNVEDEDLPQKVKQVTSRYPRCRGHLDALGGEARIEMTTSVTTEGPSLKATTKRAKRATTLIKELRALVTRQQHTQCFHAG